MATTRFNPAKQFKKSTAPAAVMVTDASSEAGYLEASTGSDRIVFYDDSANAIAWLTLGTNLSITGTTINASAGAGGYTTIQEEGSDLTSRSKLNFEGAGFTAADDAGNSRTNVTLDATLNSLAAYNTNGFLVQTAADTFAGRSLTAPAAGFTITNNDGVAGNPTFVLANDLSALEGLASTGIAVRTAADTWAQRTLQGTSGRVTVTNGDGVSGDPTIDISSNVAFKNANETISGTWTFSNNITMNGTPSANTDVITLGFLNSYAIGMKFRSVQAASTGTLTITARTTTTLTVGGTTFTVDGRTMANGEYYLLKDGSTGVAGAGAADNGAYVISGIGSSVLLTRAAYMDAANEVDGNIFIIEDGTANAGTIWSTVSEVTTLGTDTISFTQVQTTGTVTGTGAANRIAYWAGTSSLTSNSNFFLDGSQIAFGTATPATSSIMTTKGTGTGTSTYGYTHQNSSGTNVFRVADDGTLTVGPSGSAATYSAASIGVGTSYNISSTGGDINISTSGGFLVAISAGGSTSTAASLRAYAARAATSGSQLNTLMNSTFAPTFGTASFIELSIATTINQTGGANGPSRLIYVNPTVAAAPNDAVRGLELTLPSTQYSIWSTAGKVRFDLGSDATGDLPVRSSTGQLTPLAAGTSGYVLTSNGAGTLPSWQAAAGTVTIAYVEGSTSSSIDLDANTGVVKDKDGNNVAFTIPTDTNKFSVFRNGQRLNETGSLTTRDYSVNTTTHVLTLAVALSTDETLTVVKTS